MPPSRMHQTYIRYTTDQPAKRSSYMIVFDGRKQGETDYLGLPNLDTVDPFQIEEMEIVHTGAETVYCDVPSSRVGLYYQCGLSFLHRGARWQLYFDWKHRNEGPAFRKKAIEALEAFHERTGRSSPSS